MESPLLETTISGASHVIINISGDISLMDANDAASYIRDLTGEDANIISAQCTTPRIQTMHVSQ